MASIIWDRDPQEAMNNPYEYNAQKQFHREAIALTDRLSETITNKRRFQLEEQTLEKAVWMLQTDALFAFRDAIVSLEQKNHRIAGRLLRDITESIHLVEYLSSETTGATAALNGWYKDELVMHKEYRDFIKIRDGERQANAQREVYRNLSKFTHRSYKVLLYGYILGRERTIFYDEGLSLPQSISMYYAFLGYFGQLMVENLKLYGILDRGVVEKTWEEAMEEEQIPRGYLSKEDREFLGIIEDNNP